MAVEITSYTDGKISRVSDQETMVRLFDIFKHGSGCSVQGSTTRFEVEVQSNHRRESFQLVAEVTE